jgi:hypothetical protein
VPRAAPETARTVEARAATTPSPDDIRARAEEVRQRAMAARARRDAEHNRPVTVVDDEAGLFDAPPLRAEAPAQPDQRSRVEPALAAERTAERRPIAKPIEPEGRGHGGRSGLFAINKLIHRVAGGGQQKPLADPAREADRRGVDEDEGEIPAFLRRQAN